MKFFKLMGLTIVTFLLARNASGQEFIRGLVADSATFVPLPYVTVQVKNTGVGTVTDESGSFTIRASVRDTLIFSLIGYERLELALDHYETSVIRLAERPTLLEAVTIDDLHVGNPYENLFDEQNESLLKRSIPFYFSKARKDQIKAGWWREENQRVQTYVDVVINDSTLRLDLMRRHHLSEKQYYETLTAFNEVHYAEMYYLTALELVSLINRFFEARH